MSKKIISITILGLVITYLDLGFFQNFTNYLNLIDLISISLVFFIVLFDEFESFYFLFFISFVSQLYSELFFGVEFILNLIIYFSIYNLYKTLFTSKSLYTTIILCTIATITSFLLDNFLKYLSLGEKIPKVLEVDSLFFLFLLNAIVVFVSYKSIFFVNKKIKPVFYQ